MVANFAVTADGRSPITGDMYNDAISIIDPAAHVKVGELDLRPGIIDAAKIGIGGGESPFGVAIKGSDTAYVSSERDREIDVVDLAVPASSWLLMRISGEGNPNNMVLNAAQTRLYVAADNSDQISVIDTEANLVIETIRTTAHSGILRGPKRLPGAAPTASFFPLMKRCSSLRTAA